MKTDQDAKISELSQKVTVLEEKISLISQNFSKIQQDRISEAEKRAQEAAQKAEAAKQKAAQASAPLPAMFPRLHLRQHTTAGVVKVNPDAKKTKVTAAAPAALETAPAKKTPEPAKRIRPPLSPQLASRFRKKHQRHSSRHQ